MQPSARCMSQLIFSLLLQDSVSIFQEQVMGWKRKLETPPTGKANLSGAEHRLQAPSQRPQSTITPIPPSPAAALEGGILPTKFLGAVGRQSQVKCMILIC